MTPPDLQILVWWTKTHQSVGRAPVLLIPEVPGHTTNSVAAYHLLAASPTTSADQSLFTYLHWGRCTMLTVPILSQAMTTILHDLWYDASLFSLHSLCRGWAMVAYRQGLDQIKRQGLWTSNAFWQYIMSSCAATLPLAGGLACTIHFTSSTMSAIASTSSTSTTSSWLSFYLLLATPQSLSGSIIGPFVTTS